MIAKGAPLLHNNMPETISDGLVGVALDSGHNVVTLPPAVPRVGHSEVSRKAYVERRALLPLKSHYRQRKSAQGASDRAFPPNIESFPIPQGLPALSQTPRTQSQCKKERTKGTLESHVGSTLKSVAQKHFFKEYCWVCSLSSKRPWLIPPGPRRGGNKRERMLGCQADKRRLAISEEGLVLCTELVGIRLPGSP